MRSEFKIDNKSITSCAIAHQWDPSMVGFCAGKAKVGKFYAASSYIFQRYRTQ
jgi:hypothetical protein